MTELEYTKYQLSVDAFFEREGLDLLSQQPLDADADELEYEPDSYYSSQPCDVCDGLPGDRREMCGFNPTTKEIQTNYSVCPDCEYYVEYGCLDDMTMDEISSS